MDLSSHALDRSAPISVRPASGLDAGVAARAAAPPRVGVVRNPRSHRNKRRLDDAAWGAEVSFAAPDDPEELGAALVRFRDEGVTVLAIDGGDGTVRDVLTCGASVFGEAWPLLVVLPKGKTNALAVDLGLPKLWSLAEALAAARAGAVVERRPLVIEREVAGHDAVEQAAARRPPLWGFVLGAGAFIAATDAGQEAHRRGAFQSFAVLVTLVTALVSALFGIGDGALRRLSPMRLLGGDGAALPHGPLGPRGERYIALFSTLRTLPARIMPFRPADRDIRYFVVDAPRRRTLARIPAVLCGAERAGDPQLGIHRGAGEGFIIDLARDGFVLDGEAFPPGRLRLRQGPVLRFVVP